MTEKITNISIEYKENCDYNGSTANKDIVIPLQESQCVVDFLNHTATRQKCPNEQSTCSQEDTIPFFYYTDVLEIEAFFTIKNTNTPIKHGEANFYYTNKNDTEKEKQLINASPIDVDKNGNAKILFMPPESGTIEVEYLSNEYFDKSICVNSFELQTMPTHVVFDKPPAYLTSYEDNIELTVNVTDVQGKPVQYGVVTFLNYSKHDINDANDAYEKVIGNPVYVENGHATITYSPIQYESDNDLYGSLELIKAVYNYNNDLYGVNWKYYGMSKDYTSVGIYQTNQINLFYPLSSDVTLDKELGGMFTLTQGERLQLQCNIVYNNQPVKNGKVTFYLASIDNNEQMYIATDNDVTYLPDKDLYQTFFDGIPSGLYQAYAYVEEFDQDTSINIAGTIPVSLKTHLPIVDKKYIAGAYSNTYCIKIQQAKNSYSIKLQAANASDTIAPNEDFYAYFILESKNLDYFVGQPCYFYITKTKQKVEGHMHKDTANNDPVIIGNAKKSIRFSDVGDYSVYAYVPPVANKYEGAYSEGYLNIKVRKKLDISLRFKKDTVTYPNKLSCSVKVSNIYDESYKVVIEMNGQEYILENEFTKNNNTQEYTFPLLDSGSYFVKAYIENHPEIFMSQNVTINPGTLVMSMNGTSKKVNTGETTDLIIGIEEIDGKDIVVPPDNIRQHLVAALQHNDINNLPVNIVKVEDMVTDYYSVQLNGTIYDSGDWGIKIDYVDAAGNYNITDNAYLQFEAYNQKVYVQIMGDTSTTRYGRIGYEPFSSNKINALNNEYTYTIPQYILIISKISNSNNESVKFMHITDKNGKFTITKPNSITSDIAWSNYNYVEYIVDPKLKIDNTSIIETIKTTTYNDFCALFNNYNIQFDATKYNALKNQCNSFNNVNLFLGYDEDTDEIEIIYE